MSQDADILSFKQRNNFAKLTLTLFPEHVEFDFAGKRHRMGINVKYGALPGPFHYKTLRPRDFLVTIPLCFGAVLALSEIFIRQQELNVVRGIQLIILTAGYTAILCVMGFAIRKVVKRNYTVLATPAGNILIAQRGQHDQILQLIQERRKAALTTLVVIDPNQPPWKEMKKFRWLKAEGIISDQDYRGYTEIILSSAYRSEAHSASTGIH